MKRRNDLPQQIATEMQKWDLNPEVRSEVQPSTHDHIIRDSGFFSYAFSHDILLTDKSFLLVDPLRKGGR